MSRVTPELFSDEAAVRALHEVLGKRPDVGPSNAMGAGHIAGPIGTLARLDVIIATSLLPSINSSDKVGGFYKRFITTYLCHFPFHVQSAGLKYKIHFSRLVS